MRQQRHRGNGVYEWDLQKTKIICIVLCQLLISYIYQNIYIEQHYVLFSSCKMFIFASSQFINLSGYSNLLTNFLPLGEM